MFILNQVPGYLGCTASPHTTHFYKIEYIFTQLYFLYERVLNNGIHHKRPCVFRSRSDSIISFQQPLSETMCFHHWHIVVDDGTCLTMAIWRPLGRYTVMLVKSMQPIWRSCTNWHTINEVSRARINNCFPQTTVECNYLSVPPVPVSGTKVINSQLSWDALENNAWLPTSTVFRRWSSGDVVLFRTKMHEMGWIRKPSVSETSRRYSSGGQICWHGPCNPSLGGVSVGFQDYSQIIGETCGTKLDQQSIGG